MLEDSQIKELSEEEFKNLAINCYSCLKENEKKINYMSYIKSTKNKECNNAVKRIFEKIEIEKINKFIDSISCMSKVRKEFYKNIIFYRYEVLKSVYNSFENV